VEDEGPTYYRIGIDHEYTPGQEEIHFQCTRIKKLENLDSAGASLKRLILIANCIEKIENLDALVNLEHLELYQNLVKRIENIAHLKNLNILDFSFNKIRAIEALGLCPFEKLKKLYLSSNKIDMIEGIFHFRELTLLELGANRIRDVPQRIEELANLQELWLGKNRIGSMALAPLPNLRHLSLQNNRLEVWDAALFRNCPNLMYLYLGHNNLPDLPDEFALLTELKEVDLAKNAITHIRGWREMFKLTELWMNDNQIADLAECRNLSQWPALRTVYLERNPMHGLGDEVMEANYKEAILAALPGLRQLDAVHLDSDIQVVTDGSEKKIIGIRKR
jgi:protein phosphatase 1 regulatory subunit 7